MQNYNLKILQIVFDRKFKKDLSVLSCIATK